MNSNPSRREFLKTAALAGVGGSVARAALAQTGAPTPDTTPVTLPSGIVIPAHDSATLPRPPGQNPVHDLTTKPQEKIRVGVIGCHRGLAHVTACCGIEFAEVVAVCDWRDERAQHAADLCVRMGRTKPAVYSGTEEIWEKMAERDDIDAIYAATPWRWHVPMALKAMKQGKHAFVEVPAAVTVADCWALVDTSEQTQRHCVLLENCCYGEDEMFVLNLAHEGVFGDLLHAECAYLHDLRQVLFDLGQEGEWRRDYHSRYNGNLYPTHGLGPVGQRFGLGRGDQFQRLVSMSSPERCLSKYLKDKRPNGGKEAGEKYICGDINTSVIQSVNGRTILLQHDVVCPRPYSRINALYGTGGTFFDYPPRLALDEPKKYGLQANGPEDWMSAEDLTKMREQFTHPLWKKLRERAKGGGHGGMDFIINWRLLDCLRQGKTPDSVVYDAAAWSCIVELSSRSVATGATPVEFPDFTRGLWPHIPPLPIAGKESVG